MKQVMEERISWFPIAKETELTEYQRQKFESATERLGFVPNVFRAFAWRPERFAKWRAHIEDLMEGTDTLPAAEREMVAVAVSMSNGCLYCLTSHGWSLRHLLGDPVLGDRITLDYRRAGLSPRQVAMLDYAVKITEAPLDCEEDDVEELRAHGFTDEDIWDIAELAAMFNYTNRLVSAVGLVPNREYPGMAR
jgi:uncharacterized peroxidase-related enzyme